MKRTIKQSLKMIMFKYLLEYANCERNKDFSEAEHFAERFVEEFDRYLTAYYEFKED